jgi:hypothetical protein
MRSNGLSGIIHNSTETVRRIVDVVINIRQGTNATVARADYSKWRPKLKNIGIVTTSRATYSTGVRPRIPKVCSDDFIQDNCFLLPFRTHPAAERIRAWPNLHYQPHAKTHGSSTLSAADSRSYRSRSSPDSLQRKQARHCVRPQSLRAERLERDHRRPAAIAPRKWEHTCPIGNSSVRSSDFCDGTS